MEAMTDFIFLGSKITSKDDSAMKLADAPWKESYNKHRQHIKKQKHHFALKVRIAKAMIFPVVMYRCGSWTIKKAKRQRTDAFEW